MEKYKQRYSEKDRKFESARVMAKYPEKIPMIVCKANNCNLMNIDKEKYLVPKDMTLGQFIFIIRKRIKLNQSESLFIMVNNGLLPGSKVLQDIYDSNKDDDGFLYITYTSENTFG